MIYVLDKKRPTQRTQMMCWTPRFTDMSLALGSSCSQTESIAGIPLAPLVDGGANRWALAHFVSINKRVAYDT